MCFLFALHYLYIYIYISISMCTQQNALMCFDSLLIGTGYSGSMGSEIPDASRNPSLWQYRNLILKHHGIDPFLVPKQHKLVILKKEGRRKFHNYDEIWNAIQQHLGHTGIVIEEWNSREFANFTMKEQLEKITNATIVLTPCGGVSVPFFFLPRGAALIVPDGVAFEYGGFQLSQMEGVLWYSISHIKLLRYEHNPANFVKFEDNKWRNEIHLEPDKGRDDIRNYGQFIMDPKKVLHLIDQAFFHISISQLDHRNRQ